MVLDLAHLSINFQSVAEVTIEYAHKVIGVVFGWWVWLEKFCTCFANTLVKESSSEILDPSPDMYLTQLVDCSHCYDDYRSTVIPLCSFCYHTLSAITSATPLI